MEVMGPFGNLLAAYVQALSGLAADLWLYFLLGFLVAGAIAEFVPRRVFLRYLSTNNVATLLRATLSGTVASVCSCGAIPIAVTMRKSGSSRAAALTFLLAAPWAGFMQLIIFYRFLGLAATALVFGLALLVAFVTGIVLGYLEDTGWLGKIESPVFQVVDPGDAGWQAGRRAGPVQFSDRLVRALLEARETGRELWKYLLIGLLLAAGLKAFVPVSWISTYLGTQAPFNPVLVAVPLAAVVELCSEGFSVFAGQLYSMGATLAVVFVIVLVGVTTDFTELSVIFGKFGKRCAAAYLVTATTLCVLFALILQQMVTK